MHILITGAAGFIGAHTAKRLLENGHSLLCIDVLDPYYDPQLKKDRFKALVGDQELCTVDITDYDALNLILEKEEKKVDAVIHLAAQAGVRYSLEKPFVYEATNIKGTLHILELMRQHAIPTLLYASSSSVYGGLETVPFVETMSVDKPLSLYAASKKATELMAYTYFHLYGIRSLGYRFFTVYGPWGRPDMALFSFTKKILAGESIDVYNNGDHARDFTYIDDIVNGVVAGLGAEFDCDIVNLGKGKPDALMEMIELLEKQLGTKAQKNMLPMQPGDVHITWADTTKANDILAYKPTTSLAEGIEHFIAWYIDYYSNAV